MYVLAQVISLWTDQDRGLLLMYELTDFSIIYHIFFTDYIQDNLATF